MNIVMIGPVYPFKGGIAHYTGLMCKNLRKQHDVTMISYKMQYPKFLFRREQKDFQNDTFSVPKTKYLIHTANPLNWISTAKKIKALKPNLLIVQWWHPYFAPCYWSILKLLRGIKVLFICHNVFPHERFPMDRSLAKRTLSCGDAFIVHSETDANDLLSFLPNATYEKTVLPTFNAFKFKNLTQQEARIALHINEGEKILLFFGFVREYKGLTYLIKAMPQIKNSLDECRLLIVGDFGNSKEKYTSIISDLKLESSIQIYDQYIPDFEVEKYFSACDLVILPYESATQSAIAQIAYGFEKPIVATNVGGLPEVVLNGQTGYVIEPRDPQQIAEAVIRFFNEGRASEFQNNVKREAYRYSWDRMNEIIERLAQS